MEQDRLRRAGERHRWNGESYAVVQFIAGRTTTDEAPEVTLRLKYADFYTFLATQQLDRRLQDGSTLRETYLSGRSPEDVPDFMACSFGVNVAVVTSDDKVVVSRRSSKVSGFSNVWSSSANEALSRSIDSRGRNAPDLHDVARRGLREELALEANEYELTLLAFMLVESHHQWCCSFVARLDDLSARELEDRWTRGESDGWEHDEHVFLNFDPRSVLSFVLAPENIDEWSPHGPVVHYLALENEYGRARVEAVSRRVVSTLPN